MLATAIAIKLDSKGPVIFRQKRHGFNNEVIEVYKFRSMYTDKSDPTARKAVTKNDPRVTRVGRFIRKTSIDELPQFFNALFGSLSLVGPRPHAVAAQSHNMLYTEVVDGYFARHRVKPGVTGWAQINGWRGEMDTDEKIRMRTEFDLYYIENWSLWFDLKILLLTPYPAAQHGKRLLSRTVGTTAARSGQRQADRPDLRRRRRLGVLLSGFVVREPAPYELYMAGLIAVWALFGLRISRTVAPLLVLLVVFNIGGMISMTQMADLASTPLYLAVSLFLAFTAVFFAAVTEAQPALYRVIFVSYVIAAVVTSMLGMLGYFDALPGGEIFTKFGRAAGAFQDPNVFGPFLALPGIYLLHRHMTGSVARMPLYAVPLLIIVAGIFFSFSRGAWGLFAVSADAARRRPVPAERQRPVPAAHRRHDASSRSALLVVALLVILQIPGVAELFTARAQLAQDYDSARLGRFARYTIGFLMAMEHPLGIGPLVFGRSLRRGHAQHLAEGAARLRLAGICPVSDADCLDDFRRFQDSVPRPAMAALSALRLCRLHRPCRPRQRHRHRPLAAFLPAARPDLGSDGPRGAAPARRATGISFTAHRWSMTPKSCRLFG